jgi:hypothetical protein
MKGLIYHSSFLYRLMMRVIYGNDFAGRYMLVADCIDKNWSVLDLCCGDCYIQRFLDKSVRYEGRDFNDTFVRGGKAKGIVVEHCDLKKGIDASKRYDCVIMMGSLHQFIPNEDKIVAAMKSIATRRVIISEPVKNIVVSHNKVIAFIARLLSNPGDETITSIKRLSLDDVRDIYKKNGVSRVIDAGKDLIGVIDL